MAYKVHDAVKRNLQEKWEAVCNSYLLELCNMWELDAKSYGFWIADEIGGTFCYGDSVFIDMDNIIYCVKNNVSYDTFLEWQEYCVWAIDFKQHVPNLKSWCMGCPRVDEETQKKLSDMKMELDKLMRETKEKF